VNGGDNVFVQCLSVCLSVCLCLCVQRTGQSDQFKTVKATRTCFTSFGHECSQGENQRFIQTTPSCRDTQRVEDPGLANGGEDRGAQGAEGMGRVEGVSPSPLGEGSW